ncbi:MAG: phosphoglucosamine mutase [Candidatus Ranarchaeia archaeon]
MTRLFGTNGIRGIVNKTITTQFVCKIAQCLSTIFPAGSTLLIGTDGRSSGPMLKMAAIAGLNSVGINVYDVGFAPTPAIQFAVTDLKVDGAVIITASHNPPEFNGIKIIAGDGVEIPREKEELIEEKYEDKSLELVSWTEVGSTTTRYIIDTYIDAILKHVDIKSIKARRFTAVVDPGNGVGGLTTPLLLSRLGFKVITVNGQLDGTFPGRFPEPTPENLAQLGSVVKAYNADFGVAHDGDADRAIFVDEQGRVVWGDQTFALVARHVLAENPGGKIVTPIASGSIIKDVVKEAGGEIIWTKVGSVIVSRKLIEVDGVLGGEENGGIFYPPMQPVRDGAMTTALIAQILAKNGSPLSHHLKSLPQYFIAKAGVPCPHDKKTKFLSVLIKRTSDLERNTLDGVKIFYTDGSVLIRPSGTEPKIRCFAEATTEAKAEKYLEYGMNIINKCLREVGGIHVDESD